MTALDRKLLRDLWRMKTQSAAIGLVIACGIATFVMSLCTMSTLIRARESYYLRNRFASVFAHLKRAPNAAAGRIAKLPGVQTVQVRVAVEVTLDIAGMAEPVAARLISIPDRPPCPLNDLHIRAGRWIETGRAGEVLCNEAFAEAHGLAPGDRVKAVINGKLEELRIAGVALSPEHIYQIRPGEILPDPKRYGVLWMGYAQLAAAFDLTGAFNDLSLSLLPGANERDVIRRVDELIEQYGGAGAYGREDQLSHRLVSDELTQLRAMALIPPGIFLAVSAFLLNIVVNRIVGAQREQIAMLKAFGYTGWEVGGHYLKFSLAIAAGGFVLGVAAGSWLGHGLAGIYARFFKFPSFEFRLDPLVLAWAAAAAAVSGALAVAGAVRRAAELPPAEAMRPEPPARYRPTLLERAGLKRWFAPATRMILRQIERRPLRSFLTALGIAMAAAVVILGAFSKDIIEHIEDFQYSASQRHDFSAGFVEPKSAAALHELERLPGVLRCEGFRAVPARVRFGHRSRRLTLMGLPPRRELFPLVDLDLRRVPLPETGLVISEKLGELLNVRRGGRVHLEALEGERPSADFIVTGFIRDFSGVTAYMDARALNRFMREGPAVSGAFLAVDEARAGELCARVKTLPGVASFVSRQASLESFRRTVAENLLHMRFFNIIFGCVIAFGVVYNNARITLGEMSRELATLRVIGLTRAEISYILLGGIGLLAAAATPAGLLLGYGFAALATAALETETQRFQLAVQSQTFAFAALVNLTAVVISSLIARRLLDRLDLVAVLKSRE